MAFGATEDSGELIVETQPESTKQTADPKFVNVGYGNLVVAQRVIAVISPNSSPTKRLKDDAKENGRLIDATHGRRTRSIVVTDSRHVILSAVGIETISQRFFANKETRSG